MKIVGIIQARTNSKRLPNKVLLKLGDKTILNILIERLLFSKMLDEVIVATTNNVGDDPIVGIAKNHGVGVFRGSEEDVLDRFYKAALEFKADVVVRITADNPLTDVNLMDYMVNVLIEGNYDYVAPKDIILGLGSEIISFRALEITWKSAIKKYQREHVTPYIYEHPKKFRIKYVEAPGELVGRDIRLTIDAEKDYELLLKLYEELGDLVEIDVYDIVRFLIEHPNIRVINSNIKQKPYWRPD